MNYEPWHMERLVGGNGSVRANLAQIGANGPAYTGFLGHDIVFIAGISMLWEGVADAFIFTTQITKRNGIWFSKQCRIKMEQLEHEHELHRIQAAVDAENKTSQRWAEWMGFKSEGLMKRYGPDKKDYYRYARLVGGE